MKQVLAIFSLGVLLVSGGKEKHDGGKKKQEYNVGYVNRTGQTTYSCHKGFEPVGQGAHMVCARKEMVPLLPQCRRGVLEGDMCLLWEDTAFSCPPGYAEVGGLHEGKKHGGKHDGKKGTGPLCMSVQRAPLETFCLPHAHLSNGACVSQQSGPVTMICPLDLSGKHGGKHDGKHGSQQGYQCVDTVNVPALATCAPGMQLRGDACVGIEKQPCGPSLAPFVEYGNEGKKHEGKKHGRYLQEGELGEGELGEGELGEGELGEGELGEGELGEAELVRELDARAPELVGPQRVEPIALNRQLGEKSKHDYPVPVLAPVPSKMKFCEVEVILPAQPVCPPGAFQTPALGQEHKKKKHGFGGFACAKTVPVPLEPFCPNPNALLDLATNTCTVAITEAPRSQCPPGYGPCGSESKKHKHGPARDAACCAVQYADLLPGCPANFQLFNGQCKLKIPAIFECPPGASRDGDLCYVIVNKPPKVHYQLNVTTKAAPITLAAPESKKKYKHH